MYSEEDNFYLKINLTVTEGGLYYSPDTSISVLNCLADHCTYPGNDLGFCSRHVRDLAHSLTKPQKDEIIQQRIDKAKKRLDDFKRYEKEFYRKGLDNVPDEIEYETTIEEEDVPIKFIKVKLVPREE